MLLSEKVQDFILHIYTHNSQITKKTQYLGGLQYYTMCWYLRDKKLIESKSVDKSKQKVWCLTEKGRKLAETIVEIKRIMNDQ